MPELPAPDDILCESCGYTLNGLPTAGRCPECGQPIVHSTTESPRRLPAWEDAPSPDRRSFIATTLAVLMRPGRFFQLLKLVINPTDDRSRLFALIHVTIATLLATATMHIHYQITQIRIIPIDPWLMSALRFVVVWLILLLTLRLVEVLATWEGAWWGYRLPRQRVRRVLHYASAALLPATILTLMTSVTFKCMIAIDLNFGLYFVPYLGTLSGAVVLGALYLFRFFMIAMRSIRFANG